MMDFVEKELSRVYERLAKCEPGTEEYTKLLGNADQLFSIEAWYGAAVKASGEDEKPPKTDDTPTHVKEAVEEALGLDTPVKAEPFPEPFPEPFTDSAPEPKTGRTYTKEEVRAALAESRKRGVKVTALLGELGYDNFSAVPAGEYGAVMAKLGEA